MATLSPNEDNNQIITRLALESEGLDTLLALLAKEKEMIVGLRDLELLEVSIEKQRLVESLVSMRQNRKNLPLGNSPEIPGIIKDIEQKTELARSRGETNRKLVANLMTALKGAVFSYQKAVNGGSTYSRDGNQNNQTSAISRNQYWG
ncbi:flagellar protein FlgN [Myxococcota bacterium]|nr:flagellar protein FlgN [Myxococcota bacterium]MBU1381784.1 flagellar protein FlgN [Myxococcota bacterium]MBU1496456.1 flagellar protein FlgN [Myxococcota bacterium]